MAGNHLFNNFLTSRGAGLKPMSGLLDTNHLKKLWKRILQFAALCPQARYSP